jgi:hypothetical protein
MANEFNVAQAGTLSPEDYAQQQALNRQQRYADMLLQQNQQPQGQMVSGRYVAPSFFQYAAPLFQTYAGKSLARESDAEAVKLAEKLRKGETEALADFEKIKRGTPSVEGGIYGPDNQLTMQTTPDMIGPQGELTSQYRKVAPVAGVAPNTQSAYANLYADPRATQRLRDMAFAKMTSEPEAFTLSADQTRFLTMPDGTSKQVAVGVQKPTAPTTDMQNFLFAKERGEIPQNMGFLGYQKYIKQLSKQTEDGLDLPTVNNNGLPVGRFDKTGRYISPQGRVFPASAVTEAQKEHDVTMDLANKLNNLTKGDIKNAFGSVMDYTGSKVGQMVGRKDVVDAQNKINSIQIKNVLDNLSQLKGASSDKEMAQMIKDFPAYTADPEIMEKWTDRAAKTANRFLKRSEQRFGFDTEYAQEDRFGASKEKNQPSTKANIQDENALAWANANPNDPRSAQIKQRLGK